MCSYMQLNIIKRKAGIRERICAHSCNVRKKTSVKSATSIKAKKVQGSSVTGVVNGLLLKAYKLFTSQFFFFKKKGFLYSLNLKSFAYTFNYF